jgi:hypothetical protein
MDTGVFLKMKLVTDKGHGLGWKRQLPDHRDYRYERHVRVEPMTLPTSVDLSNLVSTVKDQGQLGACVAHGTTSVFEACQIKLAGASTLGCRLLVYRDARIIGGDFPGDNGCNIRDGIQATVKNGVAPETDWAYNISQFDNTPPAKAVSDAVKAESTNYYLLDSTSGAAQTLLNIQTCLAVTGLPVAYGFPVYDQYESVGRDGIIDMPSGDELGGHCNMFFGYKPGYLMTLNSWGQGWGAPFGKFSGGMGWMPTAYVTQGLVSDSWTIANESQISPTPTPTPVPPTPTKVKVASAPSVCASGANMDMVVKGSDSAVWWRHYDGATWGVWVSLGGVTNYSPAITSIAPGTLDVFAHGTTGALYHKRYTKGVWSAWDNMGGGVAGAPDAVGTTAYVQGTTGDIYSKPIGGAWKSLGGDIT